MSLFQCENCGCCENTALAAQGFKGMADLFDWSGIEDRAGKLLCSACGPVKYSDQKVTKYGKWHGQFSRVFLPMGEFKTNQRGNLEHIATGSEDFRKFSILRGSDMPRSDKCECSLPIRLTGDGCRYCQPQNYIDRLETIIAEERAELEAESTTQYRLLKEGEVVRLGDEFLQDDAKTWAFPERSITIGSRYGNLHRVARRKITA